MKIEQRGENLYSDKKCIGFIADKKIYLQKCPKCRLENYAMAVASGQCAWCGCEVFIEGYNIKINGGNNAS